VCSYDDYTFHIWVENGIIYLAMSAKELDRQVRNIQAGALASLGARFGAMLASVVLTDMAAASRNALHVN